MAAKQQSRCIWNILMMRVMSSKEKSYLGNGTVFKLRKSKKLDFNIWKTFFGDTKETVFISQGEFSKLTLNGRKSNPPSERRGGHKGRKPPLKYPIFIKDYLVNRTGNWVREKSLISIFERHVLRYERNCLYIVGWIFKTSLKW